MKWIKRIVFSLLLLIVVAFVGIYAYFKLDTRIPYAQPNPIPVVVPTFSPAKIDFTHHFNSDVHLPVMGAAIIDVDGDQLPELWLGGGENQHDGLFKYQDGAFIDISESWGLHDFDPTMQSYGPTAYDLDEDGDMDLLVCKEDDVYMYVNQGGSFQEMKLNLPLDEKSAPISVTCGDINEDGLGDMFVSTYLHKDLMQGQTIFNEESYGSNSMLLLNRGMKFEDITETSGLNYTHNTFIGVMLDVDEDGDADLVVAHDTGEVRTYKNNGDLTFETVANPMTGKFGYPMGIAIGDYDNNGKPDFFFSNAGSTMPEFLLKGDLKDDQTYLGQWLLFSNQGDFKFKNVAETTHLANYEFAWGAIFEDFNLDGLQDLVVAENYVDLPNFKLVKLPCRFLLNTPDHQFVSTEAASGVVNENYAISPLTADFNNDGYPDLVYSNINGPAKAWINDGGSYNFLKVRLEQTASAMGAKVEVITGAGKTLTDWMITGEGLGSDQSHILVFGLGEETRVTQVNVFYLGGKKNTITDPAINQTLYVSSKTEADSLSLLQ